MLSNNSRSFGEDPDLLLKREFFRMDDFISPIQSHFLEKGAAGELSVAVKKIGSGHRILRVFFSLPEEGVRDV
ncbi:hypothetical protein AD939_06990 [Gluconobacter oxydans]|nr:hypothetical protein AD939_06990 [Gluconobacter oxydans]